MQKDIFYNLIWFFELMSFLAKIQCFFNYFLEYKTQTNKTKEMSSNNKSNKPSKDEGWKSISTYSITKGFGGMHGFMQSYGIRHYEEGAYEEAMEIINEMKKNDYHARKESNKK